MFTLAFDTSSNKGGVAVLSDDTVIARQIWEREGSHGELLTPALDSCVRQAGLTMRQMDRIAIGHGPGSFTGVRIAVNAARALSYALQKPIYAFGTDEILAEAVEQKTQPLAVVINAHKNMVYASTFVWQNDGWTRQLPLAAMTLDELDKNLNFPHLCVGDGFDEFKQHMNNRLIANLLRDTACADEPVPEAIGRLAHKRASKAQALGWKDVQALYIRASGAEEKLREDRGS